MDNENDPGDTFSLDRSTRESSKQSNDPGNREAYFQGPIIHIPTSQESRSLPQPDQSHKQTSQHGLQAAGLSDSLKMSPPLYHLGSENSSMDTPRSTRNPEKPINHQGIPMPLTSTTSASLVAEHVRAPILSSLSVNSDVMSLLQLLFLISTQTSSMTHLGKVILKSTYSPFPHRYAPVCP